MVTGRFVHLDFFLKATDNNGFPFFSQPFSGMTDEMTSFQDILLSAHSLSFDTKKY
jgi:hypothetical protein